MKKSDPPHDDARKPGTTWVTKLSASAGIVAAAVLSVLLNVFVARHYKRWDWTRGGLYTLSAATLETLHSLEEPVKVFVLIGSGDPISVQIDHMLDAYRAETTRLDVEFTDPDRHPAEFLAIQQRYGVVAGKTEDGRILTDASIIVVRGDRPHFITGKDLVEIDDADDTRARPRLEQALTGAIRSVLAKEQPTACFTSGHGEASSEGGGQSASGLRDKLVKNNFAIRIIAPTRADPKADDALAGCRVLIMAGPEERVPPEDVARYKAYIEKGGSALLAIGPQPDPDRQTYLKLGVDELVALAGVKLDQNFVFELDPKYKSTRGFGETFTPMAKPHAITEALLKAGDRAPPVLLTIASSLEKTAAGIAAPVPLLETSGDAFGMTDFFAWAKDTPPPSPGKDDKKGPLVVAYATELPKPAGSTDAHGPRMVVVGSTSPVLTANWQNDELRGTAIFVESAITWLTARPVMLDIPNKPVFASGMHVSDDELAAIFRKVIVYLPLTSVLLGVAVYLRRRGERRGPPNKARTKGEG